MSKRKKISQKRIKEALKKIVELFKTGNVPAAIALATFPPFDVPACKWSIFNKTIMITSGTSDARGWKQWQKAGRKVKKGAKAFYILAPRMVPATDEVVEKDEDKPPMICKGFFPVPVFPVEMTEGEPLDYENIELPELPLLEKAQEWGISVKGIPFQELYYGYYQPTEEEEKIRLATPEEKVFFHELAHAAHRRVKDKLAPGQEPEQEIVAELSAAVLGQLVGTKVKDTRGNSFEYIQRYAKKMDKSVGQACKDVLGEVDRVLGVILGG